jgi:predicted Ser/Thr protein kinase
MEQSFFPIGAAESLAPEAARNGSFLNNRADPMDGNRSDNVGSAPITNDAVPTVSEKEGVVSSDCTQVAGQQMREASRLQSTLMGVHKPNIDIPGHEILDELGRGGMGVVYKARQLGLNRLVALKMSLSGDYAGAGELMRFRHEAEAVAKLQHPGIVQIYAIDEVDGKPYFCLEYVDGGSLQKKLAGTPQPPRQAAELLEKLARAMAYAHEHHIIHRDLKPANVLLTAAGEPKIADFGLAKQLDDEHERTQSGSILGTPSYMAPEQALGRSRDIGPGADIYSLGVILYEALVGRPPFQGQTVLDTLEMVRSQEPVAPSRLQPKIPRDLEKICLMCLQKDPTKRYKCAVALAEDLRRFQAGEPVLARTYSLRRAWRRVRRPALGAVLVFAVAALLYWGRASAPRPPEEPQSAAMQKACKTVPWEPLPVEEVAGKPLPRDLSGFEVLESSWFVDFSRWRPVPPEQVKSGRYEPAFATTVLRLRKRLERANNRELSWQFRTSGYAIDPRCAGRPCRVRKYGYLDKMPDDRQGQIQKAMTVWELVINLDDIGNDGSPFEVVFHAIWWNAFQDQERKLPTDWLGTRLDYPVAAANQAILLPPTKQLKSWGFSAFPKDTEKPSPSDQSPGSYVNQATGKLIWQIPDPKVDWVYRIDWSWKDR